MDIGGRAGPYTPGIRRGVAGNWYWFFVGGASVPGVRVLNDRSSVMSSVRVAPGEQLLITVRGPKASLSES